MESDEVKTGGNQNFSKSKSEIGGYAIIFCGGVVVGAADPWDSLSSVFYTLSTCVMERAANARKEKKKLNIFFCDEFFYEYKETDHCEKGRRRWWSEDASWEVEEGGWLIAIQTARHLRTRHDWPPLSQLRRVWNLNTRQAKRKRGRKEMEECRWSSYFDGSLRKSKRVPSGAFENCKESVKLYKKLFKLVIFIKICFKRTIDS